MILVLLIPNAATRAATTDHQDVLAPKDAIDKHLFKGDCILDKPIGEFHL
jgi:hypothetical protein